MSTIEQQLSEVEAEIDLRGCAAALDYLARVFRDNHRFHELFEIRKIQIRRRLGLPLLNRESNSPLAADVRQLMETQLLEACREVGTSLIGEGRVREGWMYLQPLAEPELVGSLLKQCDVNDDNADDLIEVAIAEGNSPELGFRLVLDRYGTCNAITTFDSYMPTQSLDARRAVAGLLVQHLYQELLDNMVSQMKRSGSQHHPERLNELIRQNPELFLDGAHHIDTTHLASVVRIGRILNERQSVELAIELTEYGQNLESDFQVADDPPFNDLYLHSREFFEALVGHNVDQQLARIHQRVSAADRVQYGSGPTEWWIYLLQQVGRVEQAVSVFVDQISPGDSMLGIAPTLFTLCEQLGDWGPAKDYFRCHGDLLNYSIVCLQQSQ